MHLGWNRWLGARVRKSTSVIECLLEVADRALYQMMHIGGGAVTGPIRFNAGLGSPPGHCVSITHGPFSRSPHGGVWSVRPPVGRCV